MPGLCVNYTMILELLPFEDFVDIFLECAIYLLVGPCVYELHYYTFYIKFYWWPSPNNVLTIIKDILLLFLKKF